MVTAKFSPVSVLPTPVYFYGMRSEDEIFVDIERGKTLVIRCLAVGDSDDKGMVTVFFELNGQPRRVKVPDRSRGDAASKLRRKAEPGNDAHVGAPMPGVVSTVTVAAGQKVSAGDVHVTFSLTSPGCPIGPQVSEQIEEFVTELDGVTSVESTMTFTPPWTPDRMSEDAKFALGY